MGIYTRNNAWNNGGGFKDGSGNFTDLYWYAKGVGVMMSRKLSDPTSWWFFAAIHGQYIVDNDGPGAPPVGFPNWANIPGTPQVPTTPLPSSAVIQQYWDQCQHAGWFFPPWHRGYLYALENILRGIIQGMGGPSTWALPYWNYLKQGTPQYRIPPAFAVQQLPDGTPNPLFVTARYGPNANGNVYIPIPPVSQTCQKDLAYTNKYGGGQTSFVHFGTLTGDLEQNPHNLVHVYTGGQVSNSLWGLMSDPGLAALDPIFYIHHANIDRMWAAWNAAGRKNPTETAWTAGPTGSGNRQFYMPTPAGAPWRYTPAMVNSISQLNYTYDDLSLGVSPTLANVTLERVHTLSRASVPPQPNNKMAKLGKPELVGASTTLLQLDAAGGHISVKLDSKSVKKVSKSLQEASETNLPDEVYLQLEGVKGVADANVYSVTVNHQYAGHFSLFGIRRATNKDGHAGGGGLTVRLDISTIVDQLHLDNDFTNTLDILIQPNGPNSNDNHCTIDRVSIYRVQST